MELGRIATVPNGLTGLRLAMSVIAGVMFAAGEMGRIATVICIAAALLDWLDGWFARRFDQTTPLGAYLDPLADKLLTAVIYSVIAVKTGNVVVWGLLILLLVRDVVVTVKRSRSLVSRGRCAAASHMGKIKMAVQTIGGLMVLAYIFWVSDGEIIPVEPVVFLFGLVTLLSYVSAWRYGKIAAVPVENKNSGKMGIGFADSKGACRRPGTGPL